jgi:hypothetical protein
MSLGFVIFLVICVAIYLRVHHPKPALGTAYAGDRGITLYDSSAQVRSPIGTVNYGEPLQIEQRFGDQVEVRTPAGLVGWTTDGELISTELWQQEKDLNAKTGVATPESRGHTRVLSNLHLDPGRDTPRVRQLKKDIPIELFEREAVAIPTNNSPAAVSQPESDTGPEPAAPNADGPKKEDWWLVRAQLDDKNSVSGWLLGVLSISTCPSLYRITLQTQTCASWLGSPLIPLPIPMATRYLNIFSLARMGLTASLATSPRCAFTPGRRPKPNMKRLLCKAMSAASYR